MHSPYPKIGKTMRHGHGYSQTDLYKALNRTYGISSIRNYEQGKRNAPASYLVALSKLYQCTIQDLFDCEPTHQIHHTIDTLYYAYENHKVKKIKPEPLISYDFNQSIDIATNRYQYYQLTAHDQTLELPTDTRLLLRLKTTDKIDVTSTERMYLITVPKATHPEYGNDNSSKKRLDPAVMNARRGSKQFITRAKLITDIKQGTYVMYYDHRTIKHMGYREFLSTIDGIVEKIMYDFHDLPSVDDVQMT
ncbi:MAG: helix-turn-helix transcriptional regulator [Candidatus Izemoplasma sp.]|nr:helix-turn-helix transcriptional regulator [Candidatus Izemoplasma sp.]